MKNSLPTPLEATEQEQLFTIAELHLKRYPELELMYAIPNGGSRHLLEAVNLKKQGVKSGVPDVCLPVPHGGFAALYIEMKRVRSGKASDEQKDWVSRLNGAGNAAFFCKGCEEAWIIILDYIHERLDVQNDRV